MGDFGSGRQGGWPTVEGTCAIVLDINRLVKAGLIVAGQRREGTLSIGRVLRCYAIAEAREPWAFLKLDGEAETYSDGRFALEQLITLTRVSTNFGGQRWMFLCPRGGPRAVKLYLPNGARRFASRPAYGLCYQSQREEPHHRLANRARKLRAKLDPEGRWPEDDLPPKPKGMRWRTYDRLVSRWEQAEMRADDAFRMMVGRWLRRLS